MQRFGYGIRQRAVRLVPNEFSRIQFRSIGGEKLHMNSPMPRQEPLHLFAAVNGSTVPEQEDRSAQVLEQILEKGAHIQSVKIPTAELSVKRQAFPLGRHCKCTDSRNPVLFIEMVENRSFASGSPGPGHVRDQQEPRFIQKDQMGPTSLSFFLNTAIGTVSNVQPPPRYAARRDVPASDNSSSSQPIASRHGWDDKWCQSACGLPRQSASASKGPCDTRQPRDQQGALAPTGPSVQKKASEDAQESLWSAGPSIPTPHKPVAIGRQNSWTLPLDAPRLTNWCFPVSATRWRVACVSLGHFGFHEVSWNAL